MHTLVCSVQSHRDGGLSLLLEGATGKLNIQSPLQVVIVRKIHGHVREDGTYLAIILLVYLVCVCVCVCVCVHVCVCVCVRACELSLH